VTIAAPEAAAWTESGGTRKRRGSPVPGSAYPGQAAFRAQALPGCKTSTAAVVDRSKLTATRLSSAVGDNKLGSL
jgi:hypothetical protein